MISLILFILKRIYAIFNDVQDDKHLDYKRYGSIVVVFMTIFITISLFQINISQHNINLLFIANVWLLISIYLHHKKDSNLNKFLGLTFGLYILLNLLFILNELDVFGFFIK